MKLAAWKSWLAALPPGLTQTEVARRLGTPPNSTRTWLLRCGYSWKDGRRFWTRERIRKSRQYDWDRVNWRERDIAISRKLGASRERVRQMRMKLGKKKVGGRK